MKKLIFAAALLSPAPAIAAGYAYLTDQWYRNGDQMCQYDNGTVLNVGYKICPLKIPR